MNEDNIEDVLDLHKKLAIRYKEFETTDGQIPPIVVLNEMRYALRATIKLLSQASFSHIKTEEEKDTFSVSLQEAKHALRNAYHDLVDGILIQISRIMDNLLNQYPVATAKVLGEKRLDILKDINEVEKHIAISRGDGMQRKELYEVEIYEKWFQKIMEHYQFIDQVALVEIIRENDRIVEKNIAETRKNIAEIQKFKLMVVISILGILVTVVLGLLALN